MSAVVDKFLRYVAIDTQSMEDQECYPSTKKQKVLGQMLEQELKEMGASEVSMDAYGYVTAVIPANTDKSIPALGLIAHMDTSPACSGRDISVQIIRNYDGGRILLNAESGETMGPEEFEDLNCYVGQDLITTDGTTLLGADDKAGVAEIMAAAEYLLTHPEVKHGKICIAFTPDEEVGRGTDFFDVEAFGADVAYTVDGGRLGELEYENFNAASARLTIHGVSIHPGSAKWKMKNSILVGMELQSMLPVFENPACTDGYEGFFHLDSFEGDVETTVMKYIVRDHDMDKFQQKKQRMQDIVEFLNRKYGEGTVELELKDSYFNMKEKVAPHQYLITIAEDCMKNLGITPIVTPIRGGTDGARLSFKGLPCPNLCSGGHNFHGRHEYICIQSMEKVVELLTGIVKAFEAQVGAER
ncbi:MAG: peptidase T [Eubacteriales bacterium]|nr:peptidase T [Eubacteriales bacterium]